MLIGRGLSTLTISIHALLAENPMVRTSLQI